MISLVNQLNKLSAGRILDVGIGRGQFAWIMAENFKDYEEIIGIDVDSEILKKANKNLSQFNVKTCLVQGEKYPFNDNSFDTVSIAQVLHHIPSKNLVRKLFNEMMRVLKPGGLFIIKEMFSDNHTGPGQVAVDYHHFISDIDQLNGKCHFKTFTKEEILEMTSHLNLDYIYINEFLFNDDVTTDSRGITIIKEKIHKRLDSVKNHKNYNEVKAKAETILKDMEQYGISYEKELILIGKKQFTCRK